MTTSTIRKVISIDTSQHNIVYSAEDISYQAIRSIEFRLNTLIMIRDQGSYPQLATAMAVLRGSRASGGGGLLLVFTAQNRQPRVQVSPRSMIVAVAMPSPSPPAPPPPFQHCVYHHTIHNSTDIRHHTQPIMHRILIPPLATRVWFCPTPTSPMLGHWASTQTVLSLSSPSDSLSIAYFCPCGARCRSHAGFFTSGSRPV